MTSILAPFSRYSPNTHEGQIRPIAHIRRNTAPGQYSPLRRRRPAGHQYLPGGTSGTGQPDDACARAKRRTPCQSRRSSRSRSGRQWALAHARKANEVRLRLIMTAPSLARRHPVVTTPNGTSRPKAASSVDGLPQRITPRARPSAHTRPRGRSREGQKVKPVRRSANTSRRSFAARRCSQTRQDTWDPSAGHRTLAIFAPGP